jgi:1-phosphatidylinositol-3-phosphate 5-kinase
VAYELIQNNLDVRKWYKIVYGLVTQAIELIKPSTRLLQDSMDINDYIKIKIIEWRDSSQSKYVNGLVFSKTVADKRM